MSAQTAPGEADTDSETYRIYDHRTDPFVGDTVVLSTADDRIGGTVERAVVHAEDDAPLVEIARPDGETARVPWDIVETVNSRVSVATYGCPACGAISEDCYRCSQCGRDLAGEQATVGRHGGEM
ncbi:hypothetical protein Hbl1158_17090 (plasmid) [Halobaculum sp. CBA1158]|uniref:hypothetical protein n=1 Tax=Halobaculum sp. CBA1158 TaxID=2904243 RepID=UPI001F2C0599|nr:hypothetical protein [Halobaculum sp. CBA1158]UIP01718.1 hypothetical protein Hbl1158_17090 [Halobaculum sp. CBA1158]